MSRRRTSNKVTQTADSISNIRMVGYITVHKLTNKGSVTETLFIFQCFMFNGTFSSEIGSIKKFVDVIFRNG